MKPPNKGFFITFEGGEGAGKSTLISQLATFFKSQGEEVLITREPGGSPLGDEIRKLILNHSETVAICPKAELFLFLASRSQHVTEVIAPALERGCIVLCDRFQDSSIAYQGFARKLGMAEVIQYGAWAANGLEADLTFYLDVPVEIGLARAKGAIKEEVSDRMESEKIEFHQKVRRGFLTLLDLYPRRMRKIDATASREAVFNQTLDIIKNARKTG
jgi:dTMP kinase